MRSALPILNAFQIPVNDKAYLVRRAIVSFILKIIDTNEFCERMVSLTGIEPNVSRKMATAIRNSPDIADEKLKLIRGLKKSGPWDKFWNKWVENRKDWFAGNIKTHITASVEKRDKLWNEIWDSLKPQARRTIAKKLTFLMYSGTVSREDLYNDLFCHALSNYRWSYPWHTKQEYPHILGSAIQNYAINMIENHTASSRNPTQLMEDGSSRSRHVDMDSPEALQVLSIPMIDDDPFNHVESVRPDLLPVIRALRLSPQPEFIKWLIDTHASTPVELVNQDTEMYIKAVGQFYNLDHVKETLCSCIRGTHELIPPLPQQQGQVL